MLLGIDVLARLCARGETLQSLTSVLPGHSVEQVKEVLDLLVDQGFVSPAPAGYPSDPSSFVAVYTVTPEGKTAYARVLDRWASELMGPSTMTVVERFVLTLAARGPQPQHDALMALLDSVPLGPPDTRERRRALQLAGAAFDWAQRALDADERTNAYAASARNLPCNEAEELGAVAAQLRESYAPKVPDADLRKVVEAAAASAEAAWELRLLTPSDTRGISHERPIDPAAYFDVAEHAAEALRALGEATATDVVAEATTVVESLYPPGPR